MHQITIYIVLVPDHHGNFHVFLFPGGIQQGGVCIFVTGTVKDRIRNLISIKFIQAMTEYIMMDSIGQTFIIHLIGQKIIFRQIDG